MNINQFNKDKIGIQGTGVDTITTAERNWIDKETGNVLFTIPAGTHVHVDFSPKRHPDRIFITVGDEVKVSRLTTASNWLKGFHKAPSIKSLQKQSWDGIVKTPTGHKVEPDGYGPDGCPSWMLVVGII